MAKEPLLTTLLDLDSALNSPKKLIIGGGYGLYLKQLYVRDNPQIRTLLIYTRANLKKHSRLTVTQSRFQFRANCLRAKRIALKYSSRKPSPTC